MNWGDEVTGRFGFRLPLAPLESWLRVNIDVGPGWNPDRWELVTVDELAEAVGVTGRTWHRWMHSGLTWDAADRAACAAGLHPALLWDEWQTVLDWDAA